MVKVYDGGEWAKAQDRILELERESDEFKRAFEYANQLAVERLDAFNAASSKLHQLESGGHHPCDKHKSTFTSECAACLVELHDQLREHRDGLSRDLIEAIEENKAHALRLEESEKAGEREREAYRIAVNQAMANGGRALAAEGRLSSVLETLGRVARYMEGIEIWEHGIMSNDHEMTPAKLIQSRLVEIPNTFTNERKA